MPSKIWSEERNEEEQAIGYEIARCATHDALGEAAKAAPVSNDAAAFSAQRLLNRTLQGSAVEPVVHGRSRSSRVSRHVVGLASRLHLLVCVA